VSRFGHHEDAKQKDGTVKSVFIGDDVVINSDGTIQRFTKTGLGSSTKRMREENHNELYGQLDRLISNAVFHSFEPADERHKGLKGQNVYYSAARIGGKYYSVKIKIDVSTRDIQPAYKDHKIEKEITPLLYRGQTMGEPYVTTQLRGVISAISLDVLDNSVNPFHIEDGILYQLTYEGELEEAKKAVAESRGREEFIKDQLEYSAAMDDDLPDDIDDEKEAREWLGKIYDEAAAGKEKPLSTTEIDELLAEDLRADNGKFQGFMQAAANAVDAKKAWEIRELQKAIGETYRKGTPPEKVKSGETEYKKLSPFLQRAYDDERLGIVA
jgi:hypothetical protein